MRLSNRNAASAISWKFQQVTKTRCGYFSLLRHSIRPLGSPDYFLDGPLTPAALFLFSAQLFPANRSYTATVRLSPRQYTMERQMRQNNGVLRLPHGFRVLRFLKRNVLMNIINSSLERNDLMNIILRYGLGMRYTAYLFTLSEVKGRPKSWQL